MAIPEAILARSKSERAIKDRRDRFAMAALGAMLTHSQGLATQREKIVCGAVAYADALIAELDKEK